MSAAVFALVVEDPEGGFDVVDSRSGWMLAQRGDLSSANDVACYLNATYPAGHPAPAWDTLVHEIVCWRIAGETPALYSRWRCPATLPLGPGWDHVYEEVRRHAAG